MPRDRRIPGAPPELSLPAAPEPSVPLLPLRTMVVLPGERVSLPVGRPRSLRALSAALAGDGRLLLCPQRDPECEDPGLGDLHRVATLARVLDVRDVGGGVTRVMVEGLRRAEPRAVAQAAPRLHPAHGPAASAARRPPAAREATAGAGAPRIPASGGGAPPEDPSGAAASADAVAGAPSVDTDASGRASTDARHQRPPAAAPAADPVRAFWQAQPAWLEGDDEAEARPIGEAAAGPDLSADALASPADPPGAAAVATARWLWQRLQALPEVAGLQAGPGGALPPPERPGALADALACRLLHGRQDRLAILESASAAQRLEVLHRLLLPRLPRPDVRGDVEAHARRRMERAQREYYLREQLRAIRRELGEDDGGAGEVERWQTRCRAAGLSPPALEAALREAARLEYLPPQSAEAGAVRAYLEWLTDLPWNRRSPERLDLEAARRVLDRDHFGLQAVKERVLEHLALHVLRSRRHAAPEGERVRVRRDAGEPARADAGGGARPAATVLCLTGPPGTGKTTLARSVAEALGRPFVRVSLGGVRDEADVRGHRRTYVGALPGRIVAALREARARNPVMLLDEIDKMGRDGHGDPAAALLEALDPEQQAAFRDHYLEVPVDLSDVMFVATANSVRDLPPALADRLEVVALPGYTEEEKLAILRRHLLPRQAAACALPPGALAVSTGALRALVRDYGRGPGLRALERQVAALCRKAAREVVADPGARVRVTARSLRQWLGPPPEPRRPPRRLPGPGVALALAWHGGGAEVWPLEVAVVPGGGALRLSGAMRSAQDAVAVALTCLGGEAAGLGLRAGLPGPQDVHVHAPPVEYPFDADALGLPLLLALASALTGRPVHADLGVAGGLTPRGRVVAVAALQERVLAARRAGLRRVLLPAEGRRAWAELPSSVRGGLQPVFVGSGRAALAAALAALTVANGGPARSRRGSVPRRRHAAVRSGPAPTADVPAPAAGAGRGRSARGPLG